MKWFIFKFEVFLEKFSSSEPYFEKVSLGLGTSKYSIFLLDSFIRLSPEFQSLIFESSFFFFKYLDLIGFITELFMMYPRLNATQTQIVKQQGKANSFLTFAC